MGAVHGAPGRLKGFVRVGVPGVPTPGPSGAPGNRIPLRTRGHPLSRRSGAPEPPRTVRGVLFWGHAQIRLPLPRVRRHLRTVPAHGRVRHPRRVPGRARRHRASSVHRRRGRTRRRPGPVRRGRLLRRRLLRLTSGPPSVRTVHPPAAHVRSPHPRPGCPQPKGAALVGPPLSMIDSFSGELRVRPAQCCPESGEMPGSPERSISTSRSG